MELEVEAPIKRREVKNTEKRRFNKKFEDLTKMDFDWKDNCDDVDKPIIPRSRNVISGDTFNDLDIEPKLKDVLNKCGYSKMTNIQKSSIPVILTNNNVLVKAETGSGKTLAY